MKYDAYLAMVELNALYAYGLISAEDRQIQAFLIRPLKG